MRVCAVIVTRNRLSLLKRCLRAVIAQTRPVDCIVVVDNCSSDGTANFLQQSSEQFKQIKLIRLKENQGGAGGFYHGIEYAKQNSFDFVWLMDDDGYPDKDCLTQLLGYSSDQKIIGPIVLSDTEPSILSFSINDRKSHTKITSFSEFTKLYPIVADNIILPFNGTLINVSIIRTIGLPRKEYFLWGDETEYMLRAKSAGFKVSTITDALFFHPRAKLTATPMFFGKLFFNDSDQQIKIYCLIRNSVRNYLDYYGSIFAILFFIKALWFYSFSRPSLVKIKIVLHAFYDGITKNFFNHQRYL